MNSSSPLFVARVCPICGSSENRPTVAASVPAETMSWDGLRESWRGLFKDKSFFTYHRCAGCSLLFSPTYFTDERLGALYGDMEENMSEVAGDALVSSQERYFHMIADRLSLRGGYLELGPDVGYFTRKCAATGLFDAFWLVEPNKTVWPALRKSVGDGRDAHMLDTLDAIDDIPDASLAFSASVHVLDHLTDPRATLLRIRKKVIKGGLIMSVTHDESSTLARVLGRRWPAFCLQHPQIYSGASIRELYESAGFKIVHIEKTTNYFPLGFLLRQGLWAVARMNPGFLRHADGIRVALKLGNIMAVAVAV